MSEPRSDVSEAGEKEGWNAPREQPIPEPNYWPVTFALGVTLVAWGLVASLLVSALGVAVIALAVVGWVRGMANGA